mmetsp:Transcript_71886/g.203642  ORF Transcript_71886/g.203642 Transcript_71886/m.203642 type:complete len:224 (+) Transcript_71886:82-753(+)
MLSPASVSPSMALGCSSIWCPHHPHLGPRLELPRPAPIKRAPFLSPAAISAAVGGEGVHGGSAHVRSALITPRWRYQSHHDASPFQPRTLARSPPRLVVIGPPSPAAVFSWRQAPPLDEWCHLKCTSQKRRRLTVLTEMNWLEWARSTEKATGPFTDHVLGSRSILAFQFKYCRLHDNTPLPFELLLELRHPHFLIADTRLLKGSDPAVAVLLGICKQKYLAC